MSEDVIDMDALRRLLEVIGGDQEDLDELIEEFDKIGPEAVQTMQNAAKSGDLNALRISSHSLKSNGRDFGATALADACEALEHACREGSVEDPAAQVTDIASKLERARSALKSVSLA